MIELNNENFNELIKKGLVLVDFYAVWCGPCKMMHPVVEKIADNNPDLKVIKVNVDNHNELARNYGIMSIPTLILFKDGNMVEKNIGFISEENLINLINSNR